MPTAMFTRRSALFLMLAAAACAPVRATENTTLIVLRHADRTGLLEHLNARGIERAEALMVALEGIHIDVILSPETQRNRDTVAPLAAARGLPITDLDPSRGRFGARVLEAAQGRTALYVGNIDNLPRLYAGLRIPGMPPMEYGQLHIITFSRFGHPSVERRTF